MSKHYAGNPKSLSMSDFLSCLLTSWSILLNPGKYKNSNAGSGPGIRFVMEAFRLSFDIKKLIAGGILLITVSIISVIFFPIQILGFLISIAGPLQQIPGFNSGLDSLGNSIAGAVGGGAIIVFGLLGVLFLIYSISSFLQFIGASTIEADRGETNPYSHYSLIASTRRGTIFAPISNMMVLLFLLGVFVVLTSYITYISYFGEIFLAGAFPFVLIAGVLTGLIILLSVFTILLSPGAEFTEKTYDSDDNKTGNNNNIENNDDETDDDGENKEKDNKPEDVHPFVKACSRIAGNFPAFLKGQFLILLMVVLFIPVITWIFSQTTGLSCGIIQGLMVHILTGKILNLINMQVPLWIITAISVAISNTLLISVLGAIPLVFIATSRTSSWVTSTPG